MHRKSDIENTSFEFLFQSVEVDNQTYKAQVRLYIIIRRIGNDKRDTESFALDMVSSKQRATSIFLSLSSRPLMFRRKKKTHS